jgi:4-hydroxy-3-polyprenylbenzoate decarboxylase
MQRAKALWDDLGLPRLRPQSPWFGTPAGDWLAQWDEAAARAARGDYLDNGRVSERLQRGGMKPETRFRPDEEG